MLVCEHTQHTWGRPRQRCPCEGRCPEPLAQSIRLVLSSGNSCPPDIHGLDRQLQSRLQLLHTTHQHGVRGPEGHFEQRLKNQHTRHNLSAMQKVSRLQQWPNHDTHNRIIASSELGLNHAFQEIDRQQHVDQLLRVYTRTRTQSTPRQGTNRG